MALGLTNPLGFAEQISLGIERGSQSSNTYSFGLSKPRPAGDMPLMQMGKPAHQSLTASTCPLFYY